MTPPTTIDRCAPARRPSRKVTGYQTWRELLFVHWSLDPGLIRPLIPSELELDVYEGRAWVGVVPFLMRDIRPSGVPAWAALDFLETNVRTYVHHRGVPGVYFFSLEASSLVAVKAARWMWSLPYHHAKMESQRQGDIIHYRSSRLGQNLGDLDVKFEIGATLGPSAPDTFEHFLLERYHLFVKRRERLYQGQVHHVPYPAHQAKLHHLSQSLLPAAGIPIEEQPAEVVHYAPEVTVETFGPWPVTP